MIHLLIVFWLIETLPSSWAVQLLVLMRWMRRVGAMPAALRFMTALETLSIRGELPYDDDDQV